ncbi:cytochrome o ubiquinol oxidase subunit IV [Tuberibacillus calidus]|uniref:cytochrome o ubiquinol oxidase subunit IV n=1 Tax=Tuberibacillus calidus TaxID=340097 RepID=UPI0004010A17|nr:cytochrome C oxidase subunit IV family protein [Tuberibacillus calidus]
MSQPTMNGNKAPHVPMKNLVGFLLSLILTFAALGLGLAHVMSFGMVMFIILILAVLQIVVQLYFFMHFTESDGPRYHIIGLAIAVFFVICIIGGSIWAMTFNSQAL